MEAIQKTNDKSRTGNAGYETAIRKHKIKDPGSAITHFIAMVMAAAATAPLIKRARTKQRWLRCGGSNCIHGQYDPALRSQYLVS